MVKAGNIIQKIKNARKLGIALGGGGARGIAHLGVLKILDKNGIHPQVISGTSFGSIIGALYCAGYSWRDMIKVHEEVKWHRLIDVSFKGGLMKGAAIARGLEKYLPMTFEELEKPFAVIATNLETGCRIVITSGDLITAVRASACFPGIFEPVELNGMTLIDGGLVDQVPVSALALLGADATIAVNVNAPPHYSVLEEDESHWWVRLRKKAGLRRTTLPFDILLKSLDIMLDKITTVNVSISQPDLYIQADLSEIRIHNFDKFYKIVKIGENASKFALLNSQ